MPTTRNATTGFIAQQGSDVRYFFTEEAAQRYSTDYAPCIIPVGAYVSVSA
jgi:hypothetical protein